MNTTLRELIKQSTHRKKHEKNQSKQDVSKVNYWKRNTL